ncbi:DUF6236 family protein [Streptomyces sp. NPDC093970]|uniref:DUF6236 family protein n=1 Tax=Streptomyces sp. NPDC093970 TaxID=3155076 RepID=UPI00344A4F3D
MDAEPAWGDSVLEHIGLYYPYVHVRDEQWLKTAALYMPKLAHVVPSGYRVNDSPTLRALRDELDFVVPVDTAWPAERLAPVFLDLLERYGSDLGRWYRVTGDAQGRPSTDRHPDPSRAPIRRPWSLRADVPWRRTDGGRALADLHRGELTDGLREVLLGSGLAVEKSASWTTMDAAVAWVYKRALVEEIARASAGGFSPVTDQPAAHLTPGDWDADGIASALLEGSVPPPAADGARRVGLLALRIVTPDGLADVPVQKIIRIRSRHQDLFDNFSAEVTGAVAELAEKLSDDTLPEARELLVAAKIEERFARPLEELRRAMTGLHVDTAFSAANLKFELPAVFGAGALGVLGSQPVLGATVGAAFALGALGRSATGQRGALLRKSPTAYLLSVERGLEPASLLHRLTRRE